MTNHTVLADRFVTPAIVHSQPVNAAANQLVTADSLSMQYFSHLVHVYQVRAFVCFVVCVCGGGGVEQGRGCNCKEEEDSTVQGHVRKDRCAKLVPRQ